MPFNGQRQCQPLSLSVRNVQSGPSKSLRKVNKFLSALTGAQLATCSLLLVALIGLIDYITGYELSFSIFYLIPIAASAWYSGASLGNSVCLLAATTWLAVEQTSGHTYANSLIPLWNAAVRLGFFVIVTYLLVKLRAALQLQASLAQRDGLTGIMNARTFRQRYDLLVRLAIRHNHSMAIGFLDLDGFKGINDSLGHGVGDRVLQAVAAELASRARASDIVGRLGGDEFALLLPETDLGGAQRLFTEMRERLLSLAAHNGWTIGFSIGVAVFHTPPRNPEDALGCADTLMYRVKRSGKNSILFEEYPGGSCSPQQSGLLDRRGR